MGMISRLKKSWNAFVNKDENEPFNIPGNYEIGSYYKPDRQQLFFSADRTIITSALNRIAIDIASIDVRHCRLDKNGRYKEDMQSGLNECLNVEANIDQTGFAFRHDIVFSLLNEGVIAIVPVDTTINPNKTESYDILSMRVGKIIEWFPTKVKVRLYNERTGKNQELIIAKEKVAIIENPFYSIMNEPSSILQRLNNKMSLLDIVDNKSTSGKLDLLIQVPYTIRSELRREQAINRKKDIEDQLSNSKYGIAYIDAAEKVTQLNRPVENTLMTQIEYLTRMLYNQLGLTSEILNGTANEETMNNYYSRTLDPIITAIVDEMKRKFLTKTARSQNQSIEYFIDPFKLLPISKISKIADTFTRNEILSSNEVRQIIGYKPSDDPNADRLRNSNLNQNPQNGGIYNRESPYGLNPYQQYLDYKNSNDEETNDN